MRDPRRSTASGDDDVESRAEAGVSLIEMVVALTVFALLMLGIGAAIDGGLTLSRNNRNRSVAANLASQEMDRVRSTDFLSLVPTTSSEAVGGVAYTVDRQLTWEARDATSGPCDGGSGSPAVLRVHVVVTWASMRGVQPVVSDTILTPPVGAFDPNTGHVAVKVLDRDAGPEAGATVEVTGPETRSLPTNSDGCAFFAYLAPGTYTVTMASVGYVDRQSDATPSQVVGVSVGQISSVQFDYDRAATLQLTLASSGGTVPTDVPVTLGNTQYLPNGSKTFAGSGTSRQITDLFPSADGYQAWAGQCADADPEGQQVDSGGPFWDGAQRAPAVPVSPGATSGGTVALPSATVQVLDADGQPVAGADVVATHAADHVCADGETHDLGPTDASGTVQVALPYGTWEVSVTGRQASSGTWPDLVLDPRSAGTTSFEVDVL